MRSLKIVIRVYLASSQLTKNQTGQIQKTPHKRCMQAKRKKLRSGKTSADFIFNHAQPLSQRNADHIIGFNYQKGEHIHLDAETSPDPPRRRRLNLKEIVPQKKIKATLGKILIQFITTPGVNFFSIPMNPSAALGINRRVDS